MSFLLILRSIHPDSPDSNLILPEKKNIRYGVFDIEKVAELSTKSRISLYLSNLKIALKIACLIGFERCSRKLDKRLANPSKAFEAKDARRRIEEAQEAKRLTGFLKRGSRTLAGAYLAKKHNHRAM